MNVTTDIDAAMAIILRGADEILPATGNGGHEFGGLASLLRDWAGETPFCNLPFVSLLIADNINDLHPSVAFNPRAASIGSSGRRPSGLRGRRKSRPGGTVAIPAPPCP